MTSPLPSHELRVAIDAARAGAKIALEYYNTGVETSKKEDGSIVTKADFESERIIKERISRDFPNASFLAEESGGSTEGDEFWIVDPIDGTRAFTRGIPTWDILIALCRNKEIVLGLSYYPVMDILLYAERDKGAFLNDKEVKVSQVDTLEEAFIGIGSPRRFKNKELILDLIDKTPALRALDLTFTNMLVAKGSMDAMVDAYGKTWDLAPFKVIIEEAGGKITRLDGSEWRTDDKIGALITNGLLHEELLSLIKKYS